MKKKTRWLILALLAVELVVSGCYEPRHYNSSERRDHRHHERRDHHRH